MDLRAVWQVKQPDPSQKHRVIAKSLVVFPYSPPLCGPIIADAALQTATYFALPKSISKKKGISMFGTRKDKVVAGSIKAYPGSS